MVLSVHTEGRDLPWPRAPGGPSWEKAGEGRGQAPGRGAGSGSQSRPAGSLARLLAGGLCGAGCQPDAVYGSSCWMEPETEHVCGSHLRERPRDALGRVGLTWGGAVGLWACGGTGTALVIVPCTGRGRRPGQDEHGCSGRLLLQPRLCLPVCSRQRPGPLGPSEEPLACAPRPGRHGEAALPAAGPGAEGPA